MGPEIEMRHFEDEGATSQGMQTASRSWKRQANRFSDCLLKTPEGMLLCQHLDFRLLTSRTVKE